MTEWILTASVLIVLVLGIRAVLKNRISARLRYALWALVLVRLLVPVTPFSSPLSLLNAVEGGTAPAAVTQSGAVSAPAAEPVSPPAAQSAGPEPSAAPAAPAPSSEAAPSGAQSENPAPRAARSWTAAQVLTALWLAGVGISAAVLLGANLSFARRLRRARKPLAADCPLPVYEAAVPAPCLFGLLRPAIYVTEGLSGEELAHVLAHEYTHFRQGDHIWSLLRSVCVALHWYNPLVWWAAALSRRDGELACDEGAVRRLGEARRAAYGRTLIRLSTARTRPGDLLCLATSLSGSRSALRERVIRLAKAPRTRLPAAIALCLACFLAAGAACTGAEEPSADTAAAAALTVAPLEETVTSRGLTLELRNETDREYLGERTAILQRLEDEAWVNLALGEGELDVLPKSEPLPELAPGETMTIDVDWSDYFGPLAGGTYRIVLNLSSRPAADSEGTWTAETCSGTFTVGSGADTGMDRTPTACQTQWYALELPTDIEVSAGERGASFLYNGQVVGGVDYFTCVGIQAAAERGEAVDLAVQTVVDNLFDPSAWSVTGSAPAVEGAMCQMEAVGETLTYEAYGFCSAPHGFYRLWLDESVFDAAERLAIAATFTVLADPYENDLEGYVTATAEEAAAIRAQGPETGGAPQEVLDLVEAYWNAAPLVERLHFESREVEAAWEVPTETTDWLIRRVEAVNDRLWAVTLLHETPHTAGFYKEIYQFVGWIDGAWQLMINVEQVPDDLRDQLDVSRYDYHNVPGVL